MNFNDSNVKEANMKVVLLTAVNSRLAGGLFFSVRNLGLSLLNQHKVDVTLVSHDGLYSDEDRSAYKNLPMSIYHISRLPFLKQMCYSRDIHSILESLKPDIIDIQGIWQYFSYAAYIYKKKHPDTKVIVTPRGMLDVWAVKQKVWKKKLVGLLYQNKALTNADCFIALCQSEKDSIIKYGIKSPIAIIPNGFSIIENLEKKEYVHNKTLLFIGRINPKKGISELLMALKMVKDENAELLGSWNVHIAGWNQNGHLEELINLSTTLGIDRYVTFVGQLYGEQKDLALRNASAFVLTSYSEGLPMSVLEAWAYKLPVVMTEYCNLPEGFETNSAIKVSTSPTDIKKGLIELFSMSTEELELIGQNGYNLVAEKFQWDYIATNHIELFNKLMYNQSDLK